MLERITRENALKDLHINLLRTKIVEMVETTAIRQTLVTLRCAASFKAKKESAKMPSKKQKQKKPPSKQQCSPSPNKAKKSKERSHCLVHQHRTEL